MPSAPTSLPFSETFAHPGDPLPAHLERVAQRAEASIAPTARAEARAIAFVAGLFHDLGKATPWFQAYLLHAGRRSALTHHAELGALLLWWYTAALDWPLWQRLAAFIAVRRHHGALTFQDWPALFEQTRAEWQDPESPLHRQLAVLDVAGIHAWLTDLGVRYPGLSQAPEPLTLEHVEARLRDRQAGGSKLRRAFGSLDEALAMLAGFGALLAVDKTDAALQGGRIARQVLPAEAVMRYKERYLVPAAVSHPHPNPSPSRERGSLTPLAPAGRGAGGEGRAIPLNHRREHIASNVTQTWLANLDHPLLTLTAPTGAGKTLTVLHAALQARAALEARDAEAPRIIYCLPFTSVIDQNHAVFRAVLRANQIADREDLLLKHHHLAETRFRTEDAEYQPDGADQLLTETWQSELVVTTFHQLLHSLLSPRNANLKRAGQLTGAIVLLDEVQALPLRYWEALRQLLMASARTLGTRFVLLTATRPLIFQPGDAVELLPDHDSHFRAMTRTRLHAHQRDPLTLDDFAERLTADLRQDARPTLIILNRRRAVRRLFEALRDTLPERPLVALSTDLTPLDRRARIRLIQRLLRQGEPVIAVTTQLVEAGVDFSFPVVHRDLAPLDAVIQAAGRCNRHGENGAQPGEVHLWQLQDAKSDGQTGESLWRRVYDAALIEVTSHTLATAQSWDECDFLELTQRYFLGCRARQDQQRVDEQLAQGDLIGVEGAFQLIEEQLRVSLFVARKPADHRIWEQYRRLRDDPRLSPAEQEAGFRPFKCAFYERVIQVHARAALGLERDLLHRLDASEETYDREAGFIGLPGDEPTCIL
ncbi:CRISPR-associated HD domain protein [Thiorhodococcus drewsii AZ1]|uniref:CRISPR-associated HD domain protein n=1 Tax=Thiorhodococcus drewsii AZ1 TaxID=765913 RepID=G2DYJ5_9GAMM|nr:CRISPR-associated helicase/endonuclease Cas3 [Thiorhodococcus drewsii]EGV32622.1 CRISPR-associated HD domain protein [Thiorhodococcus drewsii AZ1]